MRIFIIPILVFAFLLMPQYTKGQMEVPICTDPGPQMHPSIYGDRIVYQDGYYLYIYDFADGSVEQIPTYGDPPSYPDISGNWVVWKELIWVSPYSINLYAYNIATGESLTVDTDISIANTRPPSISGEKIVWDRGGTLYLYNLTDGSTETLGDGTWAKIEGTKVACLRPPFASEPEVYLYDLEDDSKSQYITIDDWIQKTPDLYDNKIIWSDDSRSEGEGGIWDIMMYDLDTDSMVCLSCGMLPGYYTKPAIDNNRIVWEEYDWAAGQDSEIYLYNLVTMELTNITDDEYHQSEPKVHRGRIVYSDWRNENQDIYMYAINTSPREMDVSPTDEYSFGDVVIDEVENTIVTVSNTGGAPLYLYDIELLSQSLNFYLTDKPSFPHRIEPGETVYLQVNFMPDSEMTYTETLQILSDDVDEGLVNIYFYGTGVVSEIPPDEQIEFILSQCDYWILEGSLNGSGSGRSGTGRLKALLNMIEAAGDFINQGLTNEACNQLDDIYKRTDGLFPPPDFVEGQASDDLAQMITDLQNDLSCQ